MIKTTRISVAVMLLFCFVSITQAATYYASPTGTGTVCQPASNPCLLFTALPKLVGGDTLYLRGGTYTEDIQLGNAKSYTLPSGTSDTNRTLFAGFPGETVFLSRGIFLEYYDPGSLQYVTFDNLKIINPVNQRGFQFYGTTMSYLRFQNSEVSGAEQGVTGGNWGYGGPGTPIPHHIEFINLHIHHNGGGTLAHNFYTCTHDSVIRDSHIHHATGYGIQLLDGTRSNCGDRYQIYNNDIHDNGPDPGVGGGTGGGGITLNATTDARVYNNVIWNNKVGAGVQISYQHAENVRIENNTLYGNDGPAMIFGHALSDGGVPCINCSARNNIMSGNKFNRAELDGGTTSVTYQTNLCPAADTGCTNTGNAQFTNAAGGDFSLLVSSDARNTGTTLTGFSTDLVGTGRPQGAAWDIGAYEYVEGGTPPPATTFYVDPNNLGGTCNAGNPGTITQPVCTIAQGIALLQPGNTLYLRAATYNELISNASNIPSGTGENTRTTIAGYPGEDAVLTGGTSKGVFLYYPTGTLQYVTFDNLHFDGAQFQATCGGVTYIRLQNSEIENAPASGIFAGDFAGVPNSCGNPHHFEYINLHVHHNGYTYGGDPTHNIYACQQYTVIRDSVIHNSGGYGIQWFDSLRNNCGDNSQIYNNTIYNNGVERHYGGLVVGYSDNMRVYNNVVYNNDTNGIEIVFGNLNNVQVDNNTVYGNGGSAIVLGYSPGSNPCVSCKVRNNILANNTNNHVSIQGGTTGVTYATNLCVAAATGCQTIGTPDFTNAGAADFTLQASSDARNVGTTLTDFAFDRNNAARNQGGAWEIGAYEYSEGGSGGPATSNPVYVAKTGSDANSCGDAESQSTPKLTLASACQCMTIPGKTMYIKAGTYTESLDTGVCAITGGSGPSYTNATTIASFANDAVTIKSAAGYGTALFLRASESYIIFKGSAANRLNFDGDGGAGNTIALYPGTHHIRFEYIEAKNADLYEVLYSQSANNIEIYDSLFHDGALDGIAIDGTSSGWIIQRVSSYSNGGVGISAPTYSGTHSGTLIGESRIYSNIGNGVEFGANTGAVLWNNLIYNNTGMGVLLKNNSSGTQLYNSNISGNTGEEFRCNTGATSIQLTNNIIWPHALTDNCTATKLTNQTSDPLFVSFPSNQQLQDGSTAINTGTTLLNVTTDIAGTHRPQGINYDKGAYERDIAPSPSGPDVTVLKKSLRNRGMFFN